ncbi:thiamine pyrophosphate-dependent enzyme [Nannocystaceae bacterium ST9]
MARLIPHSYDVSNPETRTIESPVPPPTWLRGPRTVSDALIEGLRLIGTQHAFGVIGGALVPFYDALSRSPLGVINCRHESGAAFAALEAALASDAPALVFTTTGPGLTNALTGALTARWEGAKLLLISGTTATARRGRFTLQESNTHTLAAGLYSPAGLFDYAVALEDPEELPRVMRTLARGFASRRGFVAHVAMPLSVQAAQAPALGITIPATEVAPNAATIAEVVDRLREPFAIWLGFGARHASAQIRELVARTNAPVLVTPRAKGVFPEDDPRYLGVSGAFGSDPDLVERMRSAGVERLLVLGTRLGEVSSAYCDDLIPPGGLIHVDLDPDVPGNAFPQVETLIVQAEIGEFMRALLAKLPDERPRPITIPARPAHERLVARSEPRIRPQYLMQCVQSRIVEGSQSVVLSESGNAFAWTTRHLSFDAPHRYRQSGLFCPMGHASAGVLGTAIGTRRRAVAIVGDGAFLMQNEISTAAQVGADVTWIVLNDARYGMVDQGLRSLGYADASVDMVFPEVDFLGLARSLGAEGARVWREHQLADALEWAMNCRGPFVLDVLIDPEQLAPFRNRLRSIAQQTDGE